MTDYEALAHLRRRTAERRALPPPAERRAARERAGATLMEVAAAVGVSRECVRLWEQGRTPSPALLPSYLDALDVLVGE